MRIDLDSTRDRLLVLGIGLLFFSHSLGELREGADSSLGTVVDTAILVVSVLLVAIVAVSFARNPRGRRGTPSTQK